MKRLIMTILGLSWGHIVFGAEGPGEFPLPDVLALSHETLAQLRNLVKSDADAASLVAKLKSEVEPMIGQPATPLRTIFYEGLINTDPRRIETVKSLKQMGDAALVLRYWQATGDEPAAETLKKWMLSWFSTYQPTGNDVNENKLFPLLVAANYFKEDISPESKILLRDFVEEFAQPHVKAVKVSQEMSNRYTKHVRLTMVCGMIMDRLDWLVLGELGVKRFVTESLYSDGRSLDLKTRDSLTYHSSALRPPLQIIMLSEQSSELYNWENAEGGSLKKSVNYMVPYALGEKTREEWTNSQVALDHKRAAAGISEYQHGKRYDPQNATELMEIAAFFDPDLMKVVRHLAGSDDKRFASWQRLINAAVANDKVLQSR